MWNCACVHVHMYAMQIYTTLYAEHILGVHVHRSSATTVHMLVFVFFCCCAWAVVTHTFPNKVSSSILKYTELTHGQHWKQSCIQSENNVSPDSDSASMLKVVLLSAHDWLRSFLWSTQRINQPHNLNKLLFCTYMVLTEYWVDINFSPVLCDRCKL